MAGRAAHRRPFSHSGRRRQHLFRLAIALLAGSALSPAHAGDIPSTSIPTDGMKASPLTGIPARTGPIPVTAIINGQVANTPWLILLRDGHIYARRRDAGSWAQRVRDTSGDLAQGEDR